MVRLTAPAARLPAAEAVVWHDVECAAYDADLEAWRSLARSAGGPVLDVGCGTGRVALDLAGRGHAVTGLDADPDLLDALRSRSRARDLGVQAHVMDARSFELDQRFALAIAPMQVVQLLGGPAGRAAFLDRASNCLAPGGVLACAIADPLEGLPDVAHVVPPAPDTLEIDGWSFTSRPLALRSQPGGGLAIDRLREAIGPDGSTWEGIATIVLDDLLPEELEAEGRAAGLRPLPRLSIPEIEGYAGSTIVRMEIP